MCPNGWAGKKGTVGLVGVGRTSLFFKLSAFLLSGVRSEAKRHVQKGPVPYKSSSTIFGTTKAKEVPELGSPFVRPF